MDIQFLCQQESLETLVFHYILNQNSKSRTVLINSILMQLTMSSQNNFYQLFLICCRIVDESQIQNNYLKAQANSRVQQRGIPKVVQKEKQHKDNKVSSTADKQYYKNMGTLLKQILIKYSNIVKNVKEKELLEIIAFCNRQAFCAVSGNQFISLSSSLLAKISQPSETVLSAFEQMLINPKMHIGSYRQITRSQLFSILLSILRKKSSLQMTYPYIQKLVLLIEDEKDPRNISLVFQIYLHILRNSKIQQLTKLKKKIFDCLEMYYPIDFQGDAQKNNIKLDDISSFLDQCLCHQLFVDELRGLLMIKMGAAPVAKYIPTFIGTRNHPITATSLTFWENLLLRTAESEYLNQQYPVDSSVTLSTLVVQLLNRLIKHGSAIIVTSYAAVIAWLDKFVTRQVLNKQTNSQNANLIICTLKDINKLCNKTICNLVSNYLISKFIQNWKQKGEILYKMGLLVPILQTSHLSVDKQKIYLLILTLNQIYHTSTQIQPKLLVLKLYMLLGKHAQSGYHKVISQTNIIVYIIESIKKKQMVNDSSNTTPNLTDVKVIKANIDFLVEMYWNQTRVRQAIRQCPFVEAKIYGLLTLAIKNNKIFDQQLAQLLKPDHTDYNINTKHFLATIGSFKPQSCLQIISKLQIANLSAEHQDQITRIVKQKSALILQAEALDENANQNILQFLDKYLNQNHHMIYFMRNVWRAYLVNAQALDYIAAKLENWKGTDQKNLHYVRTVAYFNKSLLAFKIKGKLIPAEDMYSEKQYKQQEHQMLPIQPNYRYSAQECLNWPTLIHYSWTASNHQLRTDLIQHLPTSILTSQAKKILPIILKASDITTLCKTLKNIPQQTVVNLVLPFIIQYIRSIHQKTNPEQIVSCNKILFDLEARSKQETDIHAVLVKNKGKILVAIEEKLLQHRKRRVRQSSRNIFSIYNSLK